MHSTAVVKRLNGALSVRVSRDGALTGTQYMPLAFLMGSVTVILPAAIYMGTASATSHGALANSCALESDGRPVQVRVSSGGDSPLFEVRLTADSSVNGLIYSGNSVEAVGSLLASGATSWQEFSGPQFAGWGLEPVG